MLTTWPRIITANRDKLELIAKALLEYETLEGGQVEEIVRTGTFNPPPPPPNVEPPTGAQAATPLPEVPQAGAAQTPPGLGVPLPPGTTRRAAPPARPISAERRRGRSRLSRVPSHTFFFFA